MGTLKDLLLKAPLTPASDSNFEAWHARYNAWLSKIDASLARPPASLEERIERLEVESAGLLQQYRADKVDLEDLRQRVQKLTDPKGYLSRKSKKRLFVASVMARLKSKYEHRVLYKRVSSRMAAKDWFECEVEKLYPSIGGENWWTSIIAEEVLECS